MTTAAGLHPRVSVILPFRDAADTLHDAVASIERQSLSAFECVLIDNGSKDASAEIAAMACRRDPRFRLLRVGDGLVRALNAGVAAARSPLVARMDADDVAERLRLERQLALLDADPSLSIVSCLVEGFAVDGRRAGMPRYEAWLNALRTPDEIRAALFVESPLVHPSVVMRRTALEQAGGYHDVDGPEDYDLWMRLILGGHRAAKVPEVLLYWRDSPERLTRTHPRYVAQRFFETKLRYFYRVRAPGSWLQIWGAGPIGRRWAKALLTGGYLVRRFIDVDRRKIGRLAHGVRICSPDELAARDGLILAAVGSPGAREQIETDLQSRGLRPWDDYVAVA